MLLPTIDCPVCGSSGCQSFKVVANYEYFECVSCESIFIDPSILTKIDNGLSLIEYDHTYWDEESSAARERSYGSSLARVAEAILYARRDIDVFLDIGTGPGFLLDACHTYLPNAAHKFYGVEKFPPVRHTTNANYVIGDVADLTLPVDGGCCVEVIEHLTPAMVSGILAGLSRVAQPNALFIFNSGQPSFVKNEDPGYLDPTKRGHIVSYSVRGFDHLARPHGFIARPIPGKTWAFVLEKTTEIDDVLINRIWAPSKSNRAMLTDPVMGSVMYIVGLESARAYS